MIKISSLILVAGFSLLGLGNPLLSMTPDQAVVVYQGVSASKINTCRQLKDMSDEEKAEYPAEFIGNGLLVCKTTFESMATQAQAAGIEDAQAEHFDEAFFAYKASEIDPVLAERARVAREQQHEARREASQRRAKEGEIRRLQRQYKVASDSATRYEKQLASLLVKTSGGQNPHLKKRIPHVTNMAKKNRDNADAIKAQLAEKGVSL